MDLKLLMARKLRSLNMMSLPKSTPERLNFLDQSNKKRLQSLYKIRSLPKSLLQTRMLKKMRTNLKKLESKDLR
jgi:hypothetical protein